MFTIPEQLSNATKSQFEAQLAMMTALTNKAFESVEKIVDLNMNAVRASLDESTAAARQIMGAKDAQEWMSLSAVQNPPSADKMVAYSRSLAGIAADAQAEMTKAAEAQIAETNRKIQELVDEVCKNAPAGSESTVAMMKTAIANANAGFEQLSKTTKQMVAALEANLNNAVGQYTQAAAPEKSSKSTKK